MALGWWLLAPRGKSHQHQARATPVAARSFDYGAERLRSGRQGGTETRSGMVRPGETALPSGAVRPGETALPSGAVRPGETALPSGAVQPGETALPSGAAPQARLALIVDDCGQWLSTERGFVALDVPLTLSVLPDVPYAGTIAREAAGAGKGVMLHLPMETVSGLNPGPGKVTTEMTDAQIDAQVVEDLDQIPSVRGVNNHEGSRGSADERVMHDVIGVLSKRGNLFFIDSRTSTRSVGESVAREQGVPTAARDVFLDNVASTAYTERQLRAAADIAKRSGSAIAIGHPKPTTLAAVRALIPELQAEGIQFVLAADVVGTNNP